MTCYNLDMHDQIMMIFGRSVTKKVRNQIKLLFSHLTYLVVLHYVAKQEIQKLRLLT